MVNLAQTGTARDDVACVRRGKQEILQAARATMGEIPARPETKRACITASPWNLMARRVG
jgi:hypothetical protein